MKLNSVEEIISEVRGGRLVVVIDDEHEEGLNEGVAMMAAERVRAEHVAFMARRAKGLVCLAMTQERCRMLGLPPMADAPAGEKSNFRVSIEAREGISTGISAADRARTIQAAIAPGATADDIVQPGHIFPLAAAPGGVLTRAGHTEAAADYSRLAGLQPAAMLADILTEDGELAGGAGLREFARAHQLKIGSIADLIHYRVVSERTVRRVREGKIATAYGEFNLTAYRDETAGRIHLAVHLGEIKRDIPTLARVHLPSAVRDLLAAEAPARQSWNIHKCLRALARAGCGVVLLMARGESSEAVLRSVDLALGDDAGGGGRGGDKAAAAHTTVGIGSQILRDLGVGKIRLMGAPIKYNAISGFDLEVVEYVSPGTFAEE